MRRPTRSRRVHQVRSKRRSRTLERQNRTLKSENQSLLNELEDAYQSLLLGAETQVLNEELKNKILLLEQSRIKTEQLNRQLNSANQQLNQAYGDLREFTFQIMKTLGELVEGRDAPTAGHCERLIDYSVAIARELELPHPQHEALSYGGYMHDIGKVAIPDRILLKPGRLTREEYACMKEHVVFGWKLMCNLPAMEETAYIVRHHHERYDGTGYPDGLVGEHIPITARVLALADVFDALITRRPYKEPYSLDKALDIIRCDTGSHFDPLVVDAFFRALAQGAIVPEPQEENG